MAVNGIRLDRDPLYVRHRNELMNYGAGDLMIEHWWWLGKLPLMTEATRANIVYRIAAARVAWEKHGISMVSMC